MAWHGIKKNAYHALCQPIFHFCNSTEKILQVIPFQLEMKNSKTNGTTGEMLPNGK
jgi:hypothetical protein